MSGTTFDRHSSKHPTRKDHTRHEGARQQSAQHEQPSGLDVRAEQEEDAGPEGESGGPLAQAHGQDLPTMPSGTATSSRTRRTTSRPTPAPLRPCRGISRCASAAGASAFTSSGSTKSRPSLIARACAHRVRAIVARGDAPRATSGARPRGVHDGDDVVDHGLVHVDLADGVLASHDVLGPQHRLRGPRSDDAAADAGRCSAARERSG